MLTLAMARNIGSQMVNTRKMEISVYTKIDGILQYAVKHNTMEHALWNYLKHNWLPEGIPALKRPGENKHRLSNPV